MEVATRTAVSALADFVGSTTGIIRFAAKFPAWKIILGTEEGMKNVIRVPEEIRVPVKRSLDRMLALEPMAAMNPATGKEMILYRQERIPLNGSATRNPCLVGGDQGYNQKQTVSLPGSSALRAGNSTSSARSGSFLQGLP